MIRHRLTMMVAPVIAAALVALSAWLLWDGTVRRDAETAGTEAAAAARDAIVAMGSYRPDTVEKNLTAASDLLTGAFRDSFAQAAQTVAIPTAIQKAVSSEVSVPAAGVISAQPDWAVLLAYVDRTLTFGTEPPQSNPARYRVTMQKVDGRWLVAGFDQI